MKKEEFEQQIQTMIPRPEAAATTSLYELGLDISDESGPQDILTAFDFIVARQDF